MKGLIIAFVIVYVINDILEGGFRNMRLLVLEGEKTKEQKKSFNLFMCVPYIITYIAQIVLLVLILVRL